METNKGHLHLHTGASDGLITIEDIAKSGIGFAAITDHDTMEGIEKFKALEKQGIDIIPAIELSARHMGKNMHIVVYYPEYKPEFIEVLSSFRRKREQRGVRTAENLNSLGFRISIEEMTRGNIVTKGTIANSVFSYPENRELLGKQGITTKDAFIKTYLNNGGLASVELKGMDVKGLFSMVNGVKVLAHPGHNLGMGIEDYIIDDLVKNYGIWGMEVWTRKHSEEEEEHYYCLAKKLGLYPTMSNDVHFPEQLEKNNAPYYMLEAIRKQRKK